MTTIQSNIPILGFAAYSGTGKTTLLTAVIPLLKSNGIRVGIIKHAHHTFDIDQPGKDSYKLRKAGAEQMLIASSKRWALMVETPKQSADPSLQHLVRHLQSTLDIILVEGFKNEAIPKIELHRKELGHDFMHPFDVNIIAVATNGSVATSENITQLDIDNPQQVADFIVNNVLKRTDTASE